MKATEIAFAPAPTAKIILPSGLRFDLYDPQPDGFTDEDLALRLASIPRWGGSSLWGRPMSVAQHSLLVVEIMRQQHGPLDRVTLARELLHDADEAFLGFDCITPLKPMLGPAFKALTERLLRVVFDRYAIPWWSPAEYMAHKMADRLAAASEAVHVAGWQQGEILSIPPLDADPLAEPWGCDPWRPWPHEVAAERFLRVLRDNA